MVSRFQLAQRACRVSRFGVFAPRLAPRRDARHVRDAGTSLSTLLGAAVRSQPPDSRIRQPGGQEPRTAPNATGAVLRSRALLPKRAQGVCASTRVRKTRDPRCLVAGLRGWRASRPAATLPPPPFPPSRLAAARLSTAAASAPFPMLCRLPRAGAWMSGQKLQLLPGCGCVCCALGRVPMCSLPGSTARCADRVRCSVLAPACLSPAAARRAGGGALQGPGWVLPRCQPSQRCPPCIAHDAAQVLPCCAAVCATSCRLPPPPRAPQAAPPRPTPMQSCGWACASLPRSWPPTASRSPWWSEWCPPAACQLSCRHRAAGCLLPAVCRLQRFCRLLPAGRRLPASRLRSRRSMHAVRRQASCTPRRTPPAAAVCAGGWAPPTASRGCRAWRQTAPG